ncbi:MAG: Smr/MutS family protein [Gammaproteobacteria bacterium]|nr:Smr/MutS family protein [Gammaproteobacteria bacterium]
MAGYKLNKQETELFRQAMRGVKPLIHDKVLPLPSRLPPIPRQRYREEAQVLQDMLSGDFDPVELETGEELWYTGPGVQHTVLRKLRRGGYSVLAELDLHGMTVAEARAAIATFLYDCQALGLSCVRIIHGKGFGSKHKKPVLKNKLNHWLQQREEVLAFCSARQVDGGTGAVYVLIKRR